MPHQMILFVILLVASLFCSPSLAESTDTSSTPKQVTVAIGSDSIPYYFLDDQKKPSGLVVDIWRLWSKKTGIKVVFKSYTFGNSLKAVANGRADIQAGCFYSKERKNYLDFVSPVALVRTSFFFKRSIFGIKSLKDLRGFRIGVIAGDYAIEYLRKALPQASLAIYPDNVALFSAVAAGDIVAFVKDTAIALSMLGKRGIAYQFRYLVDRPLYEFNWFCAVRRGNNELAEVIARGMAEISQTERAAMERRWTGQTSVKAKDELIIACPKNYPPFSMLSQAGNPSGMLVDFWNFWASKTGRKIKFRFFSWEDSLDALQKAKADIHSGLFRLEEREKFVDFSRPFYQIDSGFFYPLSGQALNSLTDLDGKKVGSVAGSAQLSHLRRRFPKMRPTPLPDRDALVAAAQNGGIAAFVSEVPVSMTLLERRDERGAFGLMNQGRFTNRLHAAVAKGERKLLRTVDQGLKSITRREMAEIESRWISDSGLRQMGGGLAHPRLTSAEMDWLAEQKVVTIAGESNWPPLDFADQNGSYQGVAADYLKLIGRRLGLRFEVITDYPWAQMIQLAKERKIGGISCIAKRKDREEFLTFSDPYFVCPYVIVTGKDHAAIKGIEDLFGEKTAVEKGYFLHGKLEKEYPQIPLLPVKNTLAALNSVRNKKSQAYIGNLMVIKYLIRQKGLGGLKIAGPAPWPGSKLRIGVRKDWPRLVSSINKALATISPEEHQRINRRWMTGPGAAQPSVARPDLAAKERAWLAAHKVAIITSESDWPSSKLCR